MPRHLLVTGGTGFIGRELCRTLIGFGHQLTVLTRRPAGAGFLGPGVATLRDLSEWTPDRRFDAVINLAGEPIMARRWSEARKRVLWDSRVTLTQQLVEAMRRARVKPEVFLSGSAIGLYGDQGDRELGESSEGHDGFGRELCLAWEAAARQAEADGIRVCLLRTGLVIGPGGGFLRPMLLPFRLGLGGRVGDGRQWMSWIHRDDHVALMLDLLEAPGASGPFNLTAPQPVTNLEFTRTLVRQLGRPAWLPVPASLLRLAAGEMAGLLLGSQRVLPRKALERGFRFRHETLDAALGAVLNPESPGP